MLWIIIGQTVLCILSCDEKSIRLHIGYDLWGEITVNHWVSLWGHGMMPLEVCEVIKSPLITNGGNIFTAPLIKHFCILDSKLFVMGHKHLIHTHMHTHVHMYTLEDGPTSPAACLRLDVRCCRQLHSSHLLWIYYLLCSSKHWFIFPRKSKRTDTHSVVLLKIWTFRGAAAHETNIYRRRKSTSPSWVLMMCAQLFLLKKKKKKTTQRWLMKYQSVLYASVKLEHQRPPSSHQNPWVQCFFFSFFPTHAALQSLQIYSEG